MRTFTTFREYLPAYKGNVLRCCLLGIVTTLMAITSGVHAAEITGTFGSSAGNINLTAEGPNDWIHWGLGGDTAVDRKLGVTVQISDFTPIGLTSTGSSKITFSWSDGNPTPSATTKTGIRVTNRVTAFSLVPMQTPPSGYLRYICLHVRQPVPLPLHSVMAVPRNIRQILIPTVRVASAGWLR